MLKTTMWVSTLITSVAVVVLAVGSLREFAAETELQTLESDGETDYAHLAVLFSLLAVSFVSLGTTSSDFLCPNLGFIAKALNLDDKIAGMTLLALGNSAPDLSSTFIAMRSDSITLALGELMGSAFLCITVVIGLMGSVSPFQVDRAEFLRDLLCFATFICVSFWFILDGKLTLVECILLVVIYVIYLSYLVVSTVTSGASAETAAEEQPLLRDSPEVSRDPQLGAAGTIFKNTDISSTPGPVLPVQKAQGFYTLKKSHSFPLTSKGSASDVVQIPTHESLLSPLIARRRQASYIPGSLRFSVLDWITSDIPSDNPDIERALYTHEEIEYDTRVPTSVFSMVFPFTNEFDYNPQHKVRCLYRNLLLLVNTLCYAFFTLSIPTYSGNGDELTSEYCEAQKKLFVVQVFAMPLLLLFKVDGSDLTATSHGHTLAFVFPVCSLVLAAVAYIGLFCYYRHPKTGVTRNPVRVSLNNSKHYRVVVASSGFAASLLWISVISGFVINILETVGGILHMSKSILGLTFFALGNSIGDIVTNVSFAKLGLAMRGLGACFGSPLLYILLGIGLNGIIVITKQFYEGGALDLTFEISHSLFCTIIGMVCVFAFYLVVIPANGWVIDRKVGALAVFWWCIITAFNVYYEVEHH